MNHQKQYLFTFFLTIISFVVFSENWRMEVYMGVSQFNFKNSEMINYSRQGYNIHSTFSFQPSGEITFCRIFKFNDHYSMDIGIGFSSKGATEKQESGMSGGFGISEISKKDLMYFQTPVSFRVKLTEKTYFSIGGQASFYMPDGIGNNNSGFVLTSSILPYNLNYYPQDWGGFICLTYRPIKTIETGLKYYQGISNIVYSNGPYFPSCRNSQLLLKIAFLLGEKTSNKDG